MKRTEIPQLTAQSVTPRLFMRLVDEFLDFIVGSVCANRPFLPLIDELTTKHPEASLVAYDALGGGGLAHIASELHQKSPSLKIFMRDQSVEIERSQFLDQVAQGVLQWQVPGSKVPAKSIAISINAFHRLKSGDDLEFLKNLAANHDGILIGEGNNKSMRQVIGMTIIVPLFVLLTTPFIKPFRLSRLFWTYLIPVMPLMIVWDGIATLFRLHTPEELMSLAERTDRGDFEWRSGKLPNNRGGFIIYLVGTKKA